MIFRALTVCCKFFWFFVINNLTSFCIFLFETLSQNLFFWAFMLYIRNSPISCVCSFGTFSSRKNSEVMWNEVEVAQLCPTLCDPHGLYPARILCPWNSPGKNTGVGSRSLLQGIFPFPARGLNPGLLHCRQTPYCLSPEGRVSRGTPCTRSCWKSGRETRAGV